MRQGFVQDDRDEDAAIGVEPGKVRALLVENVEGHSPGGPKSDLPRALQRLHLHRPKRPQGAGLHRAHPAGPGAVLADVCRPLQQARAPTLARQLDQSEAGDSPDLDPGAIFLERVLELLLDSAVVPRLIHVDEVDDDQAGEVPQSKLARGFLCGFEIGSERGRLDIALTGRPPGVDVDGHQGLSLVDHQVAARLQRRDRRIDLTEVILDLVLHEEGDWLPIRLHLSRLRRHQHAHEIAGLAKPRFALDKDLIDVLVIEVPDGPLHEVLFLVDQGWRHGMKGSLANVLPKAQQIVIVALDLRLGAFGARRADDQAHALRDIQSLDDRLEPLAIRRRGDLPGNAPAPGRIRHQDAVTPCKGQIGRQGRALVAALFLDHLDQHDLAAPDDLLDLVAAHESPTAPRQLFFHDVVIVA